MAVHNESTVGMQHMYELTSGDVLIMHAWDQLQDQSNWNQAATGSFDTPHDWSGGLFGAF